MVGEDDKDGTSREDEGRTNATKYKEIVCIGQQRLKDMEGGVVPIGADGKDSIHWTCSINGSHIQELDIEKGDNG